ncbi:sodium:proton antiporter NhaD [Zeaxanthinibacter enoshimensis]|uniref:Na+/H+ antiporter NhaD/arsenite permease-like protein n=1 Tax=Zeaxanthinibacter enoshimensis TaxID=392009 RepID=A0A4R6TMZ1_9FLAO|nr:sodium:proton antiporter NhaD [Zeaxanthinibacter enoshimensis]TDQ31109.1 Na+/H+ antiporter NhaD/arsenite permease-like protein [Zeaxanthinibacter enoshimensis]
MATFALIFIIGYVLIALEHKIKIDKAGTALFLGVLLWLLLVLQSDNLPETLHHLKEHFEDIAEILFFLLGAMTIVELIDSHNGFGIIQRVVRINSKTGLLWTLSGLTFFLSAVLDNLTTTIVMMAILKKFMTKREELWFFAGFIVIAANAGGAWSPIGDVTTIMLWNGGQVTTGTIITETFLPSVVCLLVPLLFVSFRFRGVAVEALTQSSEPEHLIKEKESNLILALGVFLLLMVPVFKAVTHLPPFMGMLFSLSIFWISTEILHRNKPSDIRHKLTVAATIQRIDTPSILFFLGILLAVASMEANGTLLVLGQTLETSFSDFHITNTILGLLSAVIDNVPLVAGAMGMYSMEVYPQDHEFWTFLAYCAGTGGSVLIIGSAAGVAAMGILKIDFVWYLKRMAWLALIGYLCGIGVFMIMN